MAKPFERLFRSLAHFFMWDVLRDRRTRPSFVWVGVLILFGTVIFHWLEGWSWIDSLYFCVITLATVGYGDFTPTTPLAKLLTIFYVLNGVGVIVTFLSVIADVRRERFAERRGLRASTREDA